MAKDSPRDAPVRLGRRIRWGLFWTIVAFGFGGGATWYYREDIFRWLLVPAGEGLSPFEDGLPVFTAPADMLMTTFGIAIRGGLLVALPVFTLALLNLFAPVMSPRLRRRVLLFLFVTTSLFVGGVFFAYYVMLPVGLEFLLHFGDGVAVPLITVREYLELLFALMFWTGAIFEIPVAMFMLSKMRIMPYQRFKRIRKFVPFLAIILGTIITPGVDPVAMFLVAIPIVALYEVGLFFSWMAHPEQGNYMFVKTLWRVINSPYRAVRWVYRKARFW